MALGIFLLKKLDVEGLQRRAELRGAVLPALRGGVDGGQVRVPVNDLE